MKNSTAREESHLTIRDGYYMMIILMLYGILSFFNLGSTVNPQTFWYPKVEGQQVTIDLETSKEISKIKAYCGSRFSEFRILISDDNETYTELEPMSQRQVFFWQEQQINKTFRYMTLITQGEEAGSFGEIGFYDPAGNLLPIKVISDEGQEVADEQDTIPNQGSYLNSTYFDEIYHARTAYEYAHNMAIYEWTHPPLGKLIMSIPIRVLGMSTFSYRLMNNISGILMLLVIYILAKRMFKDSKYAFLAMLLFAVDGMHFVQTRIGTVDCFLVLFIMLAYLFMYQYVCCDSSNDIKKMHLNLFASGLFLGAAMATKWSGAYSAIGLAIIFFMNFFKRNHDRPASRKKWSEARMRIILACFVYFGLIPIIIYIVSYIPDMIIRPEYATIKGFIGLQKGMYSYHSGLNETHPYSSPWYLWPLGIKPVWYYMGVVPQGFISSISVHCNPFIWWTGLLCMLYTFYQAFKRKDTNHVFLTIAILTAYLPYALIPRIMFMYHYFPVVPFMILTIVDLLQKQQEKGHKWYIGYAIIAVLIFAFFYPIYSGLTIPEGYAALMKWLPKWQLY